MKQLQQDAGNKFSLVNIDAGVDVDLMKKYSVEEIPVYIMYKNGQEVWRKKGIIELDEFKKQISSN